MEPLLEKAFRRLRYIHAKRYLPSYRDTILDIGCGLNAFFLREVDFKQKVGMEIDKDEFNAPKTYKLIKRNIINGIPLEANSADCITMLANIEHLPAVDVLNVLKDCYRVLRRRGRIIITTPAPISKPILALFACLKLVSREEIAEHKYAYCKKDLIDLLVHAGFKCSNIYFKYFECWMNNLVYADK